MDKYLKVFESYLNQLSDGERDEVMNFYSEYLQDGGFTNYDDIVTELGTPKQLARKVLADYSIRILDDPDTGSTRSKTQQSKTQVRTIWLIGLAILSTPVTIPMALVAFAVMAAVLITLAAVLFAIVVTIIAVFIGGLTAFFVGFGVLGASMGTGLTYIGGGLTIIGLFVLLIPLIVWIIRGIIRGALAFSRWLYSKLARKNKAEERRAHK
ncbi:DUF1700 domain-containing protein [Secundilactobacillus collinoides]|uniref:Integral membrane protein n=3 Tax=Secundilactobacillus collinoides TaxID=33960 RepID=A0A0R2BFG7_SECCO|nr:DUF1700 domain-containing protein [Secundilactobacillus collinoides]KRM74854.1 hypothetical protein FC82_GL002797 [Secundilactobacillus collinoides DSM 20515 = JCM 1123]KZL39353.1 membrane protein [Secundilactobacillus collinoides]